MKFQNWKNQYIELVQTKPEIILPIEEENLTPSGKAALAASLAIYPDLFCEIGCGSGNHLIEVARRSPKALCVGFELRFKRVYKTGQKAERAGLTNLRVLRTDAKRIGEYFPEKSIDRIYINFPDPWDKRVWKKNRILSGPFLTLLARLLRPGATIFYKTDHKEYFEETLTLLNEFPRFACEIIDRNLPNEVNNICSEFEQLFRRQSLPVYFAQIAFKG